MPIPPSRWEKDILDTQLGNDAEKSTLRQRFCENIC